jgi:predicted ATPase/class 3 adenylate cyclase
VSELEERKVVSVLFCDLVGFTAASERQDPEDVRARLRPYHARIRREIERYGGTVEKFVGDAVMAVFGAPVAHEDDPERAVRSGLAILDAINDLNEGDSELQLKVRVGITTGEAVVTLSAHPERGEGFATGDVVNTAARIQTAAPVDGVAVCEQTYRSTRRVFDYERLPDVTAKGKADPVSLWWAKGARARFGSDVGRGFRTPFVGRELEKPLLIGTFERASQQRSVQFVTVVGEPGVGKSRLIAELLAYVHGKPDIIRWRQGRCLPYGDGIGFWALGEIVKAEAGILESDSAEAAEAKLDATVSPSESERAWLLQRLAPLVGLEAATDAHRDELFTAWRRFIEGLAATRSSVLVFEDLHWADDALLAFLEYLGEWAQDVPLLVVCAARPELYDRRPGWGAGQRNAHTINLSPLSDRETAQLVSYLTHTKALEPRLERMLLERAGGNPLYAEEYVRLLADRTVAPGSDALDEAAPPDSVQAIIAARLDTLQPDRKGLLQDAAVLGKVFWAGALVQISGRNESDVELALHELGRKELVRGSRTSSMAGEHEYSFWHLLIRDVAYAQIPRVGRARRHRDAAAWIERKAGERVEDVAQVLAYHYLQALDLAQAAGEARDVDELLVPARRFLALAGERALGLDTAQGEAQLARALELTPASDPARSQLLVAWADAAFQTGRPLQAASALEEALADLRARSETEAAASALGLRSRVALRLGESDAVALAGEAVRLLEQRSAGPALVAAYTQLANAQSVTGAGSDAIESADRACALARTLGVPEPARAVAYRGYCRSYVGDRAGIAEMERALELLKQQGAGRDAAAVQNNLALARYPLEGPGRALAVLEAGIAFCAKRGLTEAQAALEANCCWLLAELGRVTEAMERVAALAPASEGRGDTRSLIELRSIAFTIRLLRGERTDAEEVDWLIQTAREIGATELTIAALAAAATALCVADPDRARSLLTELAHAPAASDTPYYGRHLPMMVRAALAAGDGRLATRLIESVQADYPLSRHAIAAARAQLAEAAHEYPDAATWYTRAAAGWRSFGNLFELAQASLGLGRCLCAMRDGDPVASLLDACRIFESLGYEPARTEAANLVLASGPAW